MSCIYIFTNAYPYNNSEPFFHSELLSIAQNYESVKIFPKEKGNLTFELPVNVEIINAKKSEHFNITKSLKKSPKLVLVFLFELMKSKRRFTYLKHYKTYLSKLVQHYNNILPYIEELKKENAATYYTYWLNDWAIELSLYKYLYNTKVKLVSRVHGYDFDEIQIDNNFHIFRHFVLSKYNSVVSISNYGKQYIENKYQAFKSKFSVSYLGVINPYNNMILDNKNTTIVSCSSVIKLKRLDLIIEILTHIKQPITWIHIGNGELLEEIKIKAQNLPSHITIEWLGNLSNKEVLNYYANKPITLFINTSDYEGLPYSMIEAISYGIPVCGRNVCGIPEIVNNETGVLLEKDFDVKTTAQKISEFLIQKSSNISFRENIKLFWHKNFNADVNYPNFIKNHLVN